MKESKERFIRLLRGTGREGIENVVNVIGELGFFEAPASSRFHLNQQGGLLQHSLNVCDVAMNVRDMMIEMDRSLTDYLPIESVIIASLLRDTCKADIYRPTIKKQKTEMGVWVSAPGYDVDHSNFPLGHGEKSAMLIQWFIRLKMHEVMAIRWHMGFSEVKENYNSVGQAMEKYPIVLALNEADLEATKILEAAS